MNDVLLAWILIRIAFVMWLYCMIVIVTVLFLAISLLIFLHLDDRKE